jgi:RNA polymerase sigma factor (sigma-70 family)
LAVAAGRLAAHRQLAGGRRIGAGGVRADLCGLGRLRRPDRAAAYARKVLVNRHRSLLRRAVVEARYLLTQRGEEPYEPDFGGEDQLLWRALRQLPVRQRHALVLRFYLDLPEAEVARLLGVPVGTVKSWVHRGLARMRARLGPEFQAEPLQDTEARS